MKHLCWTLFRNYGWVRPEAAFSLKAKGSSGRKGACPMSSVPGLPQDCRGGGVDGVAFLKSAKKVKGRSFSQGKDDQLVFQSNHCSCLK